MKINKLILQLTVSFAFLLIFNINNAFSQYSLNENSLIKVETKSKPISTLVSFTAQLCNKTVYLNWVVNGQKEDCIYIIQRSANDIDFKTIGYINGIGVPINIDILSCFKDTKPLSSKAYYRIATVNN